MNKQCSTILHFFCGCDMHFPARFRYDDTWKIFELMEKNNVQPDHITSSIMLMAMKKRKASAKDAWEFFQRMNRKGVKWSLDVSASLIKIFCDEWL